MGWEADWLLSDGDAAKAAFQLDESTILCRNVYRKRQLSIDLNKKTARTSQRLRHYGQAYCERRDAGPP